MTFVLFQAFGVYPRCIVDLYIISRTHTNSSGRCSNSRGLISSGPGLFFFSKPPSASLILCLSIHVLYFACICSTARFLRLLYVTCFVSVAAGKCVLLRALWFHHPDLLNSHHPWSAHLCHFAHLSAPTLPDLSFLSRSVLFLCTSFRLYSYPVCTAS